MEKWVFIRTFFILPFFLQKGKSEADEKSEMGKTLKPERGEAGTIGQIEAKSALFSGNFRSSRAAPGPHSPLSRVFHCGIPAGNRVLGAGRRTGRVRCQQHKQQKARIKQPASARTSFLHIYPAAYGVKMPRVGTETMVNLLVPLPPLAEQERIIAKIEELLPLVDRYEQAWSRLEAFNRRFPLDMQKSLLQWAIQGKLVEQRPDEGTAEELYQQIQTEKQRLAKGGKIKKEKPLPEIAEDEVPFEIPESWKWMRLRDIVEALGDGIHGTPEFDSLGRYFFINGNNLEKGKIIVRDDTKRVSYAEFEKHILDRRMCPSGHRIVETVRRIIHNERRHSKKVLCILYIFRRRRKESSWLYL